MRTEVSLEEDEFGLYTDKTSGKSTSVRRFTWKNKNDVTVQVITYGATITSIKVPDKNGATGDIVLGFNDMKGYLNKLNPYFGATVGRVANRIGNASFVIDGEQYNVTANLGENTLHGGLKGFDKVNWDYYVDGNRVVMSYDSADGEEGFPGNVLVNVTFELNGENEFVVNCKASTTKPTFVNLTNHSYFNLAGHETGAAEVYKHVVTINADKITETDQNSIPTGKLHTVVDTPFDFQVPQVLGHVIHSAPNGGYDNNFCINRGTDQGMAFNARAVHPHSGRVLEVYSNQPGVQFYTSNGLPDHPKHHKGDPDKLERLKGKDHAVYYKHGAICFETQNWPDAINHKNFPKAVLYPGEMYEHTFLYKFWIKP